MTLSPTSLADLRTDLQRAVGDVYRIERELGAGGMSQVFLAVEQSLNRQVVIKVLPPEMTTEVSAARFKREMEVTAQLQHPHVLPILSAGARENLLYYVTPYIAGETLRHRLKRDGAFPIAVASRIIREIADALSYAHRQGVVHRDIKPENIFLEDDHAILADFGVARAIVAATTGTSAGLTGIGMSVGTPGYMAPEQVSGDPNIDARADIYALGVVGYEMVAGHPPFIATSAHALAAAHLTTAPIPLGEVRADTTQELNDAIARALAKDPDDRFQTAAAFRDALDASSSGTPPAHSIARKRGRLIGMAAAVVLLIGAAAGGLFWKNRAPATLDANLLAIAPFDVFSADLQLWKEGLVDVLARNIDGAGPLRTVSPSVVIRRWKGRADRESARALAQQTGARLAVFGSLEKYGGDSVRAVVTLLDAKSGNAVADIRRNEAVSRMDRLVDSLTVGLLRELGRTHPVGAVRLAGIGSSSLPALKAFLQGEQYHRRTEWDSALVNYEQAISLDPNFALALHRAANVRGWLNGIADSVSVAYQQRASANLRGLAPRESLFILMDSLGRSIRGNDSVTASRFRRYFAIADLVSARYPNDAEAWFSVGEARFHYGTRFGREQSRYGMLEAFDRSIAADSGFAPAYLHAIELAYELGGVETGLRYVKAYNALASGDVHAGAMRLVAQVTDPATARLPATGTMIDTVSAAVLQRVGTAIGMLTDSAESAVRVARRFSVRRRDGFIGGADSVATTLFKTNVLDYRGHPAEVRKLLMEHRDTKYLKYGIEPVFFAAFMRLWPEDTLRALMAAMAKDTNSFRQAQVALVSGDTAKFASVKALYASDTARAFRHRTVSTFVDARWALLRGDTSRALALMESVPDSIIDDQGMRLAKAELLMARGKNREALRAVRDLFHCPCALRVYLALARGRAAERVGEKEIAIESYALVADAWQNADPELKRFVDEAKAGLRRLGTDENQPRVLKL